jgi:hypothetical protein
VRCVTVLILLLSFAGGDSHFEDDLRALQEAVEAVEPGAGFRFERIHIGDLPSDRLKPVHFLLQVVEPQPRPQPGFFVSSGDWLFVCQSPEVLAGLHDFLDRLRSRLYRCVCVEVRIEDRFHARALGLAGREIRLTHGTQLALHGDPEVEVAKDGGQTTDPVIETLQEGGFLRAWAYPGDDPATIRIALDLVHAELARPMRTMETGVNGELDLPEIAYRDCVSDLVVPAGRWVLVGEGIELRATPTPAERAR